MGKKVLKSSLLDNEGVVAFFTTRDLPLKYGEREDLKELVQENKRLVAQGFEIPLENLFIPEQTHSDNVEIIDLCKKQYPSCDGLVTDLSDVAIGLNFADCVPLIFVDISKKIIASAHAGWKGTAFSIGVKTIEKMVLLGSNPKDIVALIGPAIGRCCYEVGEEVKEKLLQTVDASCHGLLYDDAKVDLKLINKFQILATGVEKIDLCTDCTSCTNELFFSYRKEKGNTARHSAVVVIKDRKG